MNALGDLSELLKTVVGDGKPILGICVGYQLLFERSFEHGDNEGLGFVRGDVVKISAGRTIPHMGWNGIHLRKRHPVFEGVLPADEFYFVHAYYPLPASEYVLGTTSYGIEFPSVLGHKNLIATQFHPEKSGRAGLRLLKNFCQWDGRYAE